MAQFKNTYKPRYTVHEHLTRYEWIVADSKYHGSNGNRTFNTEAAAKIYADAENQKEFYKHDRGMMMGGVTFDSK